MTDLRQAAQQALDALEELDGLDTETECVTIDVGDVITALTAALEQQAEPVADDMEQQLADALDSAQFYRRRVESLQSWQSKMRDPERTIVCDIIANGVTLDPAGDRYTAALEQQAESVAVVDEAIHAAWSAGFVEGEKAALAQQAESVQEPVATVTVMTQGVRRDYSFQALQKLPDGVNNLYTTPPQRQWVGLTDEDLEFWTGELGQSELGRGVIRAVADKLKERNA